MARVAHQRKLGEEEDSPKLRKNFTTKLPRTTLGTGLARTEKREKKLSKNAVAHVPFADTIDSRRRDDGLQPQSRPGQAGMMAAVGREPSWLC